MSNFNFDKFIATSFGAGYAPLAPGTFGALVGCAIVVLLKQIPAFQSDMAFNGFLVMLTLIFYLLGVKVTDRLEDEWGKDPSKVVVDEMIGIWIAMLFIPWDYFNLLFAFILFRFFDILKPLGIKKLEELPGGKGVMLDDVLAGIYANLVLQFLVRVLNVGVVWT